MIYNTENINDTAYNLKKYLNLMKYRLRQAPPY